MGGVREIQRKLRYAILVIYTAITIRLKVLTRTMLTLEILRTVNYGLMDKC